MNGLRVFEVAARHLSFSRAAEELCVTNVAVSHQVKQLEDFLGLKLFERRNNQLRLSAAGENYAPRVREALRALQQATSLLLNDRTVVLRVGAPPVFGAKWLVPRLYRFFNRYPDARIDVSPAPPQSLRDCDIVIADHRVDAPDLVVERLMTTDYFPVCSPALSAECRTPRHLAKQVLLHERDPAHRTHHPTWQQWLDEVGEHEIDATRGLGFSETAMTLQAAIDGQGVALGQRALVAYDIAAGRLVCPLDIDTSMRLSYYLILPDDAKERPEVIAFRQWLNDEIARTD